MLLKALQLGVATLISWAYAPAPSPTVVLGDIGTVVGTTNATLGLDSFLGIPYVQPPVGPLRWRMPAPLTYDPSRVIHATTWGPACMQVPFGVDPELVRFSFDAGTSSVTYFAQLGSSRPPITPPQKTAYSSMYSGQLG